MTLSKSNEYIRLCDSCILGYSKIMIQGMGQIVLLRWELLPINNELQQFALYVLRTSPIQTSLTWLTSIFANYTASPKKCSSSKNDLKAIRGQFHQHSTSRFTRTDPKSVKKTVKLSSFFPLLGSAGVKAARRMLVKLTPGLNLIKLESTAKSANPLKYSSTTSRSTLFLLMT